MERKALPPKKPQGARGPHRIVTQPETTVPPQPVEGPHLIPQQPTYVPPMVPMQSGEFRDRQAQWQQQQERRPREVPPGVRGPKYQNQPELDGNLRRHRIYEERRRRGIESRKQLPDGGETSRRTPE